MHDYKKLNLWVKSMGFAEKVYQLTKRFPDEEKFGMISQMRRSSVSIPSNIAEGAGRNSNKEFGQFLARAQGSIFELETQIILSSRLNFIKESVINEYLAELESISKMIHSLRKSVIRD